MNFGSALENLKINMLLTREAWNDTSKFVFFTPATRFKADHSILAERFKSGTIIDYNEHIDIHLGSGIVEQWTPTQSDMLAKDWRTTNGTDKTPKAA